MLRSITLVDIGIVLLGLYFIKRLLSPRPPAQLPPGPKGLPFLGSALDFPKENGWLVFRKWGETWGDIMSISAFGQVFIIVNSTQIALDLLNKKSSIYSDRPIFHFCGEMVGWNDVFGFFQNTERLRLHRKWFHQFIGTSAVLQELHPIMEQRTHNFLRRVLLKPQELTDHIRHTAGAIILKISHGYDVMENDDPFIDLAAQAMEIFSTASAPGAYMVDILPALKYVPSWVPGAGFQKTAKAFRKTTLEFVNKPFNMVKERVDAGTAPLSFTSALIRGGELNDERVRNIKWCSGAMYAGGADTTVASINAFFLAMALYPDAQRKAQEEIDHVVGNDRLPTFADRESLPYVDALYKEVMRWHVVTPILFPHCSSEDDIYRGHFIPKGSRVLVNIWGLLHDPRNYPNPGEFDPMRHLGENPQPDPHEVAFGFGRRICPGRHLADSSVFISCAISLAVFNITKAMENGVPVEPVHGQTTGVVSHPSPFKCEVKPRSAKAEALILSEKN